VRFLLIINPAAGRGKARSRGNQLQGILEAAGHDCTLVETSGRGHATELARSLGGAHDAVVAVGGDGTLHEVIGGLITPGEAQLAKLGIAPAGSGDSVALDLGIGDTAEAARRLIAGTTRAVDLALVEFRHGADARSVYAANVLAWGAGARINRRAEGMRWAGPQRYNLATVVELIGLGKGAFVPLIDGQAFPQDLIGVASLTRYSGRGLLLAPKAELSDGLLDLVQIERSSRLKLARIFGAVFKGKHLSHAGVTWRQAKRLELELGPQGELVVDGELLPCEGATITMEADRLELFS
jgi:diacylglycerol kinase (ATP)